MIDPAAIIRPFEGHHPDIHPEAWIGPGAVVIGKVSIGKDSNIWPNCVIRGDVQTITIGEATNIQDGTVIHVTRDTGPTRIGSGITVGHQAILHACTLEDDCFVGMHATVMDDAVVHTGGMLAAGALLTPGKQVEKHQLWAGSPAKFFRDMTQAEIDWISGSAAHYVKLAKRHENPKNS